MHTQTQPVPQPIPIFFLAPVFIIVAVALSSVAFAAPVDEQIAALKAAPSVAEMLQAKQEKQLREQFVREGRLDEIGKLDEAQARRKLDRQQKAVAQMNDDLARSAKADSPAGAYGGAIAIMDSCDKETLRMRQVSSAQAKGAGN